MWSLLGRSRPRGVKNKWVEKKTRRTLQGGPGRVGELPGSIIRRCQRGPSSGFVILLKIEKVIPG